MSPYQLATATKIIEWLLNTPARVFVLPLYILLKVLSLYLTQRSGLLECRCLRRLFQLKVVRLICDCPLPELIVFLP